MALTEEQIKNALEMKNRISEITKTITREIYKGEEKEDWTSKTMNYPLIKENLLDLIKELSNLAVYCGSKEQQHIGILLTMIYESFISLRNYKPDIGGISMLPLLSMYSNSLIVDINKKKLSIGGELSANFSRLKAKLEGKFE